MFKNLLKQITSLVLPLLPNDVKKYIYGRLGGTAHNPIQRHSSALLQQTIAERTAKSAAAMQPQRADEIDRVEPIQTDQNAAPRLRFCNLIMVTADNNNKYYKMSENEDGTFSATYGRVGSAGVTENYPMSKWDTKYREKTRKGYLDQTALFAEASAADTSVESINDVQVQELIRRLQEYARKSISYHYNVNASQVTVAQVNEAQTLLDNLVGRVSARMDVVAFNAGLLQLFAVIPRKMKDVRDHLASAVSTEEDLAAIRLMLSNEQATLDVMRSQVEIQALQRDDTSYKASLLEVLGLEISPVTSPDTIRLIKSMMQEEARRFDQAFRVTNLRTQALFDRQLEYKTNTKTELFWHGSRNENWMSILETGLVLRPANAAITGKMFGYGLYFADRFRKSLNYTSINGSMWAGGKDDSAYLALFQVHTGNPLNIGRHEGWCAQLDSEKLKKKGSYDSVFASKGADLVNNEYIVYHENQCTIQYIVAIKK